MGSAGGSAFVRYATGNNFQTDASVEEGNVIGGTLTISRNASDDYEITVNNGFTDFMDQDFRLDYTGNLLLVDLEGF